MAPTSKRNDNDGNFTADLEYHAGRIRKDISAIADSLATAGGTLADDAISNAGVKAAELRQYSEEPVSGLRDQLALVEKRIGSQFREHPVASLALAGAAGFLIALLMRR